MRGRGACSSAGRALACGASRRGFESHQAPIVLTNSTIGAILFIVLSVRKDCLLSSSRVKSNP